MTGNEVPKNLIMPAPAVHQDQKQCGVDRHPLREAR